MEGGAGDGKQREAEGRIKIIYIKIIYMILPFGPGIRSGGGTQVGSGGWGWGGGGGMCCMVGEEDNCACCSCT